MTLAQLINQLRQLAHEHPETLDHDVRLVPHGLRPRQDIEHIHSGYDTVLLEAQR